MIADVVLGLAAQLLAGALAGTLVARVARTRARAARRRLLAARVTRSLAHALVPAAVVVLGAAAVLVAAGAAPRFWPRPAGFVLAGAPAASAVWLLLDAGRQEARGRPHRARALARRGGLVLAGGVFLFLVATWVDLFVLSDFRRLVLRETQDTGALLAAGMLVAGCGAFVGLVAGLAGKPRPSGWIAAGLWAAGAGAMAAASHLALTGGS